MLRQHARLVDASLRLVDLVVFTATLPVAHFLRIRILDESHGDFLIQKYFPLLATVLLVWMAATRMFELYGVYRTQPLTRELWRLAKSAAVAGAAAGASGFLWRDHSIPRGLLGLYIGIAFLALVLVRLLVRRLAHAARRRGFNARMFAVVGAGDLAEDVVERFGSHPEWGYSFAGYILDDDAPPREDGAPVLGRLGQLGCLLESHVLDEVVFAVPGERVSRIQESARLCEEQGIEARLCVDVQTGGIARISFGDIAGLPVLSFSSGPGDELALAAKRAFDVAASAAVLLLLAPLRWPRWRWPSGSALPGPSSSGSGGWASTAASSGSTSSAACTRTPRRGSRSCAPTTRPRGRSSRCATTPASPGSAASSARPRSTSSPSSGTSCAAR
jgi:hypothetical protein